MKKEGSSRRLDLLLLERNPGLTRSRAQAEIMAGRVLVDGRVCDKPGTLISPEASVTLLEPQNPYVSRGGLKLEGALADLKIEIEGLVVLDVGAPTGVSPIACWPERSGLRPRCGLQPASLAPAQ